jgi:hypothetical protein
MRSVIVFALAIAIAILWAGDPEIRLDGIGSVEPLR